MKVLPDKAKTAGTWVQTERQAHQRWAMLCMKNPRAGALLHMLAYKVGEHNAVVASQETLAELMGCSVSTVKRALVPLVEGNWVEVRHLGRAASVLAYVINDRVVWSGRRDGLKHSLFSANVLVSEKEQPDRDDLGKQAPLQPLPEMGEIQIPHGDDLPPPSEPGLHGLEPNLPATPERRRGEPVQIGDLLPWQVGKPETF
jgi:hypothetical protein